MAPTIGEGIESLKGFRRCMLDPDNGDINHLLLRHGYYAPKHGSRTREGWRVCHVGIHERDNISCILEKTLESFRAMSAVNTREPLALVAVG